MKTEFLHRNGSRELLIFFNGWGRDAADVSALRSTREVLEVHDYTTLDREELFRQMAPYAGFHLIAWSLGVWAAASVLEDGDFHFESALALNGTLHPVHPEYGIAPEIFDGTIANWSDASARERFLRRMAGSGAAARRLPETNRSAEDQRMELAAIRKWTRERPVPRNLFTHAAMGRRDRIIPFAAQEKFWKTQSGTSVAILDLPHYPFDGLAGWEEVLRLGNA